MVGKLDWKCSFSNAEYSYLVTIFVFSIFAKKKVVRFAPIGSKMVPLWVLVYGMLPKLFKVACLGFLKTIDMAQNREFHFENGKFQDNLHPSLPKN